jgi:hypothetical protein
VYTGQPPYVTWTLPSGVETVLSMFALTPDCDFRAEALDTVSGGHWVVHGLDTHVGVPPLSAVSMYRVWPSGAAATVPRPETELVPTVVEAEPVACAAGEPPEPPYRPPPDPFEQAARSRPKKMLTAATWRPRALDPFLIDLTSTHRFASNTGHKLAGIAPEGVMSVTSQGTLSSGTAAPVDSLAPWPVRSEDSVWPEGMRSAVAFTFDFDAEEVWIGDDPENVDRPSVLSQGTYGAKVAIPLILELLERHGIVATFFVPGRVAERHPERVK